MQDTELSSVKAVVAICWTSDPSPAAQPSLTYGSMPCMCSKPPWPVSTFMSCRCSGVMLLVCSALCTNPMLPQYTARLHHTTTLAATVTPQHNALSCVHCSAFSAICTCSGTGLPDWTLKLLHAHRIDEANMALSAAIASTNTMLRPLSRSHPAKHQHTLRYREYA